MAQQEIIDRFWKSKEHLEWLKLAGVDLSNQKEYYIFIYQTPKINDPQME